jgi:hypothetical protein
VILLSEEWGSEEYAVGAILNIRQKGTSHSQRRESSCSAARHNKLIQIIRLFPARL